MWPLQNLSLSKCPWNMMYHFSWRKARWKNFTSSSSQTSHCLATPQQSLSTVHPQTDMLSPKSINLKLNFIVITILCFLPCQSICPPSPCNGFSDLIVFFTQSIALNICLTFVSLLQMAQARTLPRLVVNLGKVFSVVFLWIIVLQFLPDPKNFGFSDRS